MSEASAIDVRAAREADVGLILAFIKELAAYEELSHEVIATEETVRASLFGDAPKAACLIGELAGAPQGFALYFHNYSTFLGRHGIYLEDLFVRPGARGSGLGKALLAKLAELVVAEGGGRLEWSVLDWNAPSIAFYRALGARSMDKWTVYRLTSAPLQRLARHSRGFRVSMIVAASREGVIGRGGALPWRLSADLKRFKSLTMGKPIIMGRKTFEGIGKPLPGRANIVVTRRDDFRAEGVIIARDPDEALQRAEAAATEMGADEICVIGGAEIYAALLPQVDAVRLTIVDADVVGDAFMPRLAFKEWRGEVAGGVEPDAKNDAAAIFVDLSRV
ncbi:MAG: dihydrofolate reductase [Pseudomonadota bacterium]